jgi:hypothetical protein
MVSPSITQVCRVERPHASMRWPATLWEMRALTGSPNSIQSQPRPATITSR